ncbi:MAG: class I SAM-dependent methyltransferase [Treponema sp.]|jgi:23S rRNA G2069 N7-methylase RlmK/C1962 C5-methylase RlmI|nr:class I SAM-dependent methyltransferase [Treponema sp.]
MRVLMYKTEGEEKTASQAEMLENRLRKRYRHLKKWARRVGTDVFRVYDRDIPEIPLVLDLYGDAVSGALYERPYEKDEAREGRWLAAMGEAVSRGLGVPQTRIFIKERSRQRGKAQYGKLGAGGFLRDVHEGDLLFRVNLSDYLDTGLFPDHRRIRAMVRAEAAGKRVLNLFCYTASFSVHAAKGGAREVDSVDMSNTYLDWGALNFALNRLEARKIHPRLLPAGGPYRLIRADALRFLAEAEKAGLAWDTIILDPPTFSNSKKMTGALDIRRDHQKLISQCLGLLSPGGKLWFSTNARNFKLRNGDFPGAVIQNIHELSPAQFPPDEDFRGRRLPACYTLTLPDPKVPPGGQR